LDIAKENHISLHQFTSGNLNLMAFFFVFVFVFGLCYSVLGNRLDLESIEMGLSLLPILTIGLITSFSN